MSTAGAVVWTAGVAEAPDGGHQRAWRFGRRLRRDRLQHLLERHIPLPTTNPKIASIFGPGLGSTHIVGIRDVYLYAGRQAEVYAAHLGGVPGDVFVMASDPSDLNTCARPRSQALAHGTVNKDGHSSLTMQFVPLLSGWYGLVETTDGPDPTIGYSSLRIGQYP